MIASRDFYEALGYLSYVISAADSNVDSEELLLLGKILIDQFGDDMQTKGIRTISRFEMCVNENVPIQEAYMKSIDLFRVSMPELKEFSDKVYEVLDDVANADRSLDITELNWIDKFREDLAVILAEEKI